MRASRLQEQGNQLQYSSNVLFLSHCVPASSPVPTALPRGVCTPPGTHPRCSSPARIVCCLLRLQLLWTRGSCAQLSQPLLPRHCGEPLRLQPLHHNLREYTPVSACADLPATVTGLAGSGGTWTCQGICFFSTEREEAKVNFNL